MNQTFTILWVEDRPKAMRGQIESIKKFLSEKEFEPNIIINETGTGIHDSMKKNDVDIVVTDKNLTESRNGMDVVNILREKKWITDVLFYSAKGLNMNEIHQQTDHYGFIEVVDGKEIVDALKMLIGKNIKRCNDIIFLRGMLISKVIDLELEINDFFCKYFKICADRLEHFNNFMMENRYNSLAGKKKTLSLILENNSLKQEFGGLLTQLQNLEDKRNILAHCKTDPKNKNILISMGSKESFDRKEIIKILKDVNKVNSHLEVLKEKFSK